VRSWCNVVLNICGYWVGRVKLLKKWREFSEGGNGDGFFLQKGKHPYQAGHQAGHQAAGHIYFPLETISTARYRPIKI